VMHRPYDFGIARSGSVDLECTPKLRQRKW
jgi:hypothetical protein